MLAETPTDCLVALGKTLKRFRTRGEQFCVLAFDCQDEDWEFTPPVADVTRTDLPFDHGGHVDVPKWDAAFFGEVGPRHTENAVLDSFGQWISDYDGTYGSPDTLFVYSFLIPCLRDGEHGQCSDALVGWIRAAREQYGLSKVHIGWSNNDRDLDIAVAIRDMIRDVQDDDLSVEVTARGGLSIAG